MTAVAILGGAALAEEPPLPPPRPQDLSPAAPPSIPAPPPVQAGSDGAAGTCLSRLVAAGARAEAATPPAPTAEGWESFRRSVCRR